MTRRRLVGLAAALTALAIPAAAMAALLWTLVMTPLTTTAGASTRFSVTATNENPLSDLGCLQVDLDSSFVLESVGVPSATNHRMWLSFRSGNSVVAYSQDGGGRLGLLQSVTFTIKAHGTIAGLFQWANHAHVQQDCSGSALVGLPLAVTVLPPVLPTPTPVPSATPSPTPIPLPTPLPSLPLPSIDPILPTPTPLPSLPLPSIDPILPTPSPTQTVDATPTTEPSAGETVGPSSSSRETPGPSGSPDGDPGASGGGGPSGGGGKAAQAAAPPLHLGGVDDPATGGSVGNDLLGLFDADYAWFVPGASVAVPGLLVIIWVILQTVGALAWIPAVRRLGAERPSRREAKT